MAQSIESNELLFGYFYFLIINFYQDLEQVLLPKTPKPQMCDLASWIICKK